MATCEKKILAKGQECCSVILFAVFCFVFEKTGSKKITEQHSSSQNKSVCKRDPAKKIINK